MGGHLGNKEKKGGCHSLGGSLLSSRKQTPVAWKNRNIKPVCNLISRLLEFAPNIS